LINTVYSLFDLLMIAIHSLKINNHQPLHSV